QSDYAPEAVQAEMRTETTLDQPCCEHRLPCVAESENDGAHQVPVAREISRDRRSHRSNNYRQAGAPPKCQQRPRGTARGGPEHGYSIRLCQQEEAQSRRKEVRDPDRGGESDQTRPPARLGTIGASPYLLP